MVNKLTRRLIGILAMMVLMMTFTLQVNAGVVTVKSNIANGYVTVDKATANQGETVTITVTPNPGYYAEKENVKGELTIDGGSAQVPGLKADNPGVGRFVNILGDEPADVSTEATYTFTMPEAPYGVQVSAVFEACTPIADLTIEAIAKQEYTGSAITPAVVVKDGDNTLTRNTDYTVEYSNNTEVGQATVTVTGKGKYTGTATVNFTIYRETYEIRWGQGSPWAQENVIPMTKDETTGKWVLADQAMEATSEFKVVKIYEDGGTPVVTWYGTQADGLYWITNDKLNTEIQLYQDNKNLYFPTAGTYTFTFDPATNKLVVTGVMLYNITIADGIVNGTVTTDPAGPVAAGTKVTINATPAEGYEVGTITVTYGDNQTVNVENNKFTMPDADVTVTVAFNPIDYTVTVAESENGTVTANPTTAHFRDNITLTITPAEDYVLETLTVDGAVVTVDGNTYTFAMPSHNVDVTATFRALGVSYQINYGKGSPSWTEVLTIPMTKDEATGKWATAADQEIEADYEAVLIKKVEGKDDVIMQAQADGQYWVTNDKLGVNIPMGIGDGYGNLLFKNLGLYTFTYDPTTKNMVITGAFEYTITVNNTTPDYGTVTAPDKAKANTTVELLVSPEEGYEVKAITVTYGENTINVTKNEETGKYTFTMPAADVVINATFEEIVVEYSYAVVEEVKCTVTGNPDGPSGLSPEGKTLTMRIVPDSGTKLKEVVVNKVTGQGPEQVVEAIEHTITVSEAGDIDLSFVMPAADVEIHVICADAYAVTVNAGEHGSATADKLEAYEGETVTVTTYPNTEYKVNEIYYTYTVDGVEQQGTLTAGENGVYTFAMPAAPVTVVVTFKTILDYYKLKFDAAPTGGTVSVKANGTAISSMDDVAEFSQITATVTPAEGYEIESFKVYEGLVNADDDLTEAHEVSWSFEDGEYRFEMPRTNATILVSFKQSQYELEGVVFTADRKWATYYNGTKNLALPNGVKAYVVNGVVNDAVDITEIGYIPAGVGVLLYSENAAEQVMTAIFTGTTGTYTSLLVGKDEEQTITSGYVLYNNNFIRSEAGSVAAHRCYLPVSEVQGAPRMLKIGVGEVPTAIESIIAQGNVAGIKYVNLNGMTSNEPFRGINIAVITFTDGTTRTMKVVK